jgi:ADP-ribosylglycohydrolase
VFCCLLIVSNRLPLVLHWLNEQALVEEATRITHTNILGIQGAVLQCAAVHLALQSDSTVADFNPVSFVDKLLAFMKEHVGEEYVQMLNFLSMKLSS